MHSCLCNKKAADILNWQPHYTIEDGLEEIRAFVSQTEDALKEMERYE